MHSAGRRRREEKPTSAPSENPASRRPARGVFLVSSVVFLLIAVFLVGMHTRDARLLLPVPRLPDAPALPPGPPPHSPAPALALHSLTFFKTHTCLTCLMSCLVNSEPTLCSLMKIGTRTEPSPATRSREPPPRPSSARRAVVVAASTRRSESSESGRASPRRTRLTVRLLGADVAAAEAADAAANASAQSAACAHFIGADQDADFRLTGVLRCVTMLCYDGGASFSR